jgi:alkanesulfonate monooxygenase SsuD/methylene tetrahydromethanopterin reductase-like flavin-dependent oxidoreductase (luciferase family)
MVGVNVLAANTKTEAEEQLLAVRRARAISLYSRRSGQTALDVGDDGADQILASGAAAHVDEMLTYTAAGTAGDVRAYLGAFVELTHADELITVHAAPTADDRLNSVSLLGHGSLG